MIIDEAKNKRLSHIKNLISIAAADDHFHESEREVIYRIADRIGVKDTEFGDVIIAPEAIEFHIPDSGHEKLELTYDLVQVMMADSDMDSEELAMCINHIKEFGFTDAQGEKLIQSALDSIHEEKDREDALYALQMTLK